MRMPILLALVLVSVPALAGDAAVDVKKAGTIDCNKTPVVRVGKGKLKVALTGLCKSVSVSGGGNEVTIDAVVALKVSGANNKIAVGRVDAIDVTGAKNEVAWTSTIDAKRSEPAVTTSGKDSVVRRGVLVQAEKKTAADVSSKKVEDDAKKAIEDAKNQLNNIKFK